jgi:hypothetical protein
MGATTHTMRANRIPGTLGAREGYVLCWVEQTTDAAVANDDILSFKNVKHVIPVGIVSEIGSVIDFDASAASGSDWLLTVNATVLTTSTAATRVEGLALIRF